jgi:hypothetical protein
MLIKAIVPWYCFERVSEIQYQGVIVRRSIDPILEIGFSVKERSERWHSKVR